MAEHYNKQNTKNNSRVKKIIKRTVLSILIILLSLIILLVSAFMFIFYSPWTKNERDLYILTTYTSSNPWLCTWFFSRETIEDVMAQNGSEQPDEPVNTTLVTPHPTPDPEAPTVSGSEQNPPEIPVKEFKTSEKYGGNIIYDDGEVQILQFEGTNAVGGQYTARLIQVKDPSRVFLGLTNDVGGGDDPGRGEKITTMLENNDALCGINAGGFIDVNGKGSGGIPLGTVVKNGVYTVYTEEDNHIIIGFNKDNILVMGDFSEEEIKEQGIRDAMSWRKPAMLILNGENVEQYGLAGGYNPRSAIGQCADGTVLLLVVDGVPRNSKNGANYALMADIMWEFDAVNAANLDGGTSSCMALNGEVINTVCNPQIAKRGRNIPTGWLVKNIGEELSD